MIRLQCFVTSLQIAEILPISVWVGVFPDYPSVDKQEFVGHQKDLGELLEGGVFEVFPGESEFFGSGLSGEYLAIKVRNVLLGELGKVIGHRLNKGTVHGVEGLLGCGGGRAFGAVDTGIGDIESSEEWRNVLANNLGINCPATGVWLLVQRFGLATNFSHVQLFGDKEERIVLGFEIESFAILFVK